jgi:hypothetical protein
LYEFIKFEKAPVRNDNKEVAMRSNLGVVSSILLLGALFVAGCASSQPRTAELTPVMNDHGEQIGWMRIGAQPDQKPFQLVLALNPKDINKIVGVSGITQVGTVRTFGINFAVKAGIVPGISIIPEACGSPNPSADNDDLVLNWVLAIAHQFRDSAWGKSAQSTLLFKNDQVTEKTDIPMVAGPDEPAFQTKIGLSSDYRLLENLAQSIAAEWQAGRTFNLEGKSTIFYPGMGSTTYTFDPGAFSRLDSTGCAQYTGIWLTMNYNKAPIPIAKFFSTITVSDMVKLMSKEDAELFLASVNTQGLRDDALMSTVSQLGGFKMRLHFEGTPNMQTKNGETDVVGYSAPQVTEFKWSR